MFAEHIPAPIVVFVALLFAGQAFAQTETGNPSPTPAAAADPKTTIAEGFGALIKRAQEAKDKAQKAGAEALEEAGKIQQERGGSHA